MYMPGVYTDYSELETRSCTGREQKRILNNMPGMYSMYSVQRNWKDGVASSSGAICSYHKSYFPIVISLQPAITETFDISLI